MSDKKTKKNQQNEEEINLEDLEKVNGGENPFDKVPRVETVKIDNDLRKKI